MIIHSIIASRHSLGTLEKTFLAIREAAFAISHIFPDKIIEIDELRHLPELQDVEIVIVLRVPSFSEMPKSTRDKLSTNLVSKELAELIAPSDAEISALDHGSVRVVYFAQSLGIEGR